MAGTALRQQVTLKNILLTTDFTEASRHAFPFATALARHFGSTVHVLHVVPPFVYPEVPIAAPTLPANEGASSHMLDETLKELQLDDDHKKPILKSGSLWLEVETTISEHAIDLLIVGSSGSGGLKRLILGSAAEVIYRRARCPVLTVGPHAPIEKATDIRHILFATNFSHESEHALRYALALANEFDAQLTMLHVMDDTGKATDRVEKIIRDSETKLRAMIAPQESPGKLPEFIVLLGETADKIVRAAELRNCDLIVMGAHEAGEIATHLPDVDHTVVAEAVCPVLTVAY